MGKPKHQKNEAAKKRAPKVTIDDAQKVQLFEYLRPRYLKIMGRWKTGVLSKETSDQARKKFFLFAKSIGYEVKSERDLRKNITEWRRKVVDKYGDQKRTGGGRATPLTETENMLLEMCLENKSVSMGAERVIILFTFFFACSSHWFPAVYSV